MLAVRSDPLSVECTPGEPASMDRWVEAIGSLYPPLRLTATAEGFRGRIRAARAPDLQLAEMAGSAHRVERRPSCTRTETAEYFKLSVQLAGTGTMRQDGREVILEPGVISLFDMELAYDVSYETDFHIIVALFPKRALGLPPGVAREMTAYPFCDEHGLGAITGSLVRSLGSNLQLLSGPSATNVSRAFLEVATTLLGDQLEATTPARTGPSVVLTRVLRYIDEHLGDSELDPAAIAAAHFMSRRQLYKVFASTGVSVARWIKQRRLEGARGELADPSRSYEQVADIAERWGYIDDAYFGRVFKDAYGVAPGQWQAVHRPVAPG